MTEKKTYKFTIAKILYICFSFFFVDALLRTWTRFISMYSLYALEPSLFTVCWIFLIMCLLSCFSYKQGRILYIILYLIFGLYSFAQYEYYLVFDRFFYLADLAYISEGTAFVSYLKDLFTPSAMVYLIAVLFVGLIGYIVFPDFDKYNRKAIKLLSFMFSGLAILGIIHIPKLYIENELEHLNPVTEYETFTNSGFDLELAGYYQYIARDAWISFLQPRQSNEVLIENVDNYLSTKIKHTNNEMTGILKGKNLLIIQMETIDDWMISEEYTPNILKLMNEGINFTDFYTPCYGSGWTFGTEFAFNTGIFQGEKKLSASNMSRNIYPYTLANLLKDKGYHCNSLHENFGSYYNRLNMHSTLGYKYICARDYLSEEFAKDDSMLFSNDELWGLMTNNQPFCSFVIAFSPHLPYNSDDEMVKYAADKFSIPTSTENEVDNLLLKSKLTDEMFGVLMDRLTKEGLIENTAIIVYDDHYSYGLTDKEILLELSLNSGSKILEKTPAFIWYKGCEHVEVSKTSEIIDLLPTIMNMLDIHFEDKVLGYDIFDRNYQGYAILPGNTWVSGTTYINNGTVINKGDFSDVEIESMNQVVNKFYDANNNLLLSDYYSIKP